MKKSSIVILIICAIFLVAGVVMVAVGYGMGGRFDFDIDFLNRRIVSAKEEETISLKDDLDAFDSIDIEVDSADLKIEEGDGYSFDYSHFRKKPEIKVENGKLKIVAKQSSNSWTIGFNMKKKKTPSLTITVPKGTDISETKLDSDAGDITLKDLSIDKLKLKSDYGNIVLKDVELGKADIDSDTGNVSFVSAKADEVKVKADYGNISVSSSDIAEFDIDVDAGNTSVDDSEIGDINVKADYGNLNLSLNGEEADYDLDVKLDAGTFMLNGEQKKNKYKVENSGRYKIKVDNDAGDLNLNFR